MCWVCCVWNLFTFVHQKPGSLPFWVFTGRSSRKILNDLVQSSNSNKHTKFAVTWFFPSQFGAILHLRFWNGGEPSTTHFVANNSEIRTFLWWNSCPLRICQWLIPIDTDESQNPKQQSIALQNEPAQLLPLHNDWLCTWIALMSGFLIKDPEFLIGFDIYICSGPYVAILRLKFWHQTLPDQNFLPPFL